MVFLLCTTFFLFCFYEKLGKQLIHNFEVLVGSAIFHTQWYLINATMFSLVSSLQICMLGCCGTAYWIDPVMGSIIIFGQIPINKSLRSKVFETNVKRSKVLRFYFHMIPSFLSTMTDLYCRLQNWVAITASGLGNKCPENKSPSLTFSFPDDT